MTEVQEAKGRRRFGNWLVATPPTIMGLPPLGLAGAGVGIVVTLIMFLVGNWAGGLLTLLLLALVLLVFVVRFGELDAGRTLAARWLDSSDTKRRRRRGETMYATGPLSQLPAEVLHALPGVLADMEEIDGVDGSGQPYTLLHHQKVGALAATFTCVPDGTGLKPQEQIDQQVSNFGGWVASQSKDSAVAGAVVVVDSALSSAEPMRQKIIAEVSPTAPQVAREALIEAANLMPAKVARVDVHGTVIWRRRDFGDLETAVAEVAARLPGQRSALYDAGAGQPVNAVSEELARVVQTAYRPGRAEEYESDELAGRLTHLRLVDAGPEVFDDGHGRVVYHDGVASMTAIMMVPPRMHITEATLDGLFAPQDKFLRKRVALFYRPVSPGEAVRKATQLRRSTGLQATSKRGQVSSFDSQKVQLAEKTERELVIGASMTRFMMMVTVTCEPTVKGVRDATTKLKSLMDGASLTYRWVEHGGSAAYHSTLPLGIAPWLYQGPAALWLEGKL